MIAAAAAALAMQESLNEVQTLLAGQVELTRTEDGIVIMTWLPYSYANHARAVAAIDETYRLGGPKPLLCVDIAHAKGLDRQARHHFEQADTAAVGLVVNSPTSRVLANFFIGLTHPLFPIRTFNSVESALEWLRQLRT